MLRPFEVTLDQLQANIDEYIDATYADLGSSTLVLPKSPAFVEYARFQSAYEVLKRATTSFREFRPDTVWNALLADSLVLVVLRTITGLTPPEWAALVSSESVTVSQNAARDLDQRARRDPSFITRLDPKRNALTLARLRALIEAA